MTDPPKKKHMKRERPQPAPPLTEAQRRSMALFGFRKAQRLLLEAEIIHKSENAPNACVHASYYVLEHCACAAILLFGGVGKIKGFPKNHADIILHIGIFTHGAADGLNGFGEALKEVYNFREISDYSVERDATNKDADVSVKHARRYFEDCCRKWDLTGEMLSG